MKVSFNFINMLKSVQMSSIHFCLTLCVRMGENARHHTFVAPCRA